MLSIVIIIYILLIQQPHQSDQLETIQVALASSAELPCSVEQNVSPINPAKVCAGRDKCL